MTSLTEALIDADQHLFLTLNGLHTPWADGIMNLVTYKFTWIPLYLYLIYIVSKRYQKKGVGILVSSIAAVAISDQIASSVFKPLFARLRPCHDPEISHLVHVIDGCGGRFGFISSHAATSFALAFTFHYLTKDAIKSTYWLYLWAFIYSFSRIYVGVHYPADLVVGALVGGVSGLLCILLYRNVLKKKLS